MRVKTMRDLVTQREQADRTTPQSREQALTELARLEHERARLTHTLEAWIANQRKTERRLEQVESRILLIQQRLGLSSASERPAPERQAAAKQPPDDDTPGWEPFVLKY